MPRIARKESLTGYYHVIMRGNNKNYIFEKDSEKSKFKELLEMQVEEGLIKILAWCIMNNHVHILLKANIEDMTLAIKRVNIKYAMRYNKRNETIGHVFQDRYKSKPIESDIYLMQVVRYIHNNPVHADLVKQPQDYKWSSYNEYFDKDIIKKNDQVKFALNYFNNDMQQFIKFHKETDDNDYLEIKEDLTKYRIKKAQNIIDKYCNQYGINELNQLYNNKDILGNIIKEIILKSGLSLRKISEYLGTSFNFIQNINSEIKKNRPK